MNPHSKPISHTPIPQIKKVLIVSFPQNNSSLPPLTKRKENTLDKLLCPLSSCKMHLCLSPEGCSSLSEYLIII